MSQNSLQLIKRAQQARAKAYAPYSGYKVGAAILAEDGKIYSGCNVENSSYGLTICAERVALFKAISAGQRRFKAVAIFTDGPATPCGACLQTLAEFSPRMEVYLASREGGVKRLNLRDLLPQPFKIEDNQ